MNEETPHEAPAGNPRACTRIVYHEVVVPLTTDVRGSNSTSTESFGVSSARLRLETPAKSSAKTAMRNRAGSNRVRSQVETSASTPWTEAAADGEPSGCHCVELRDRCPVAERPIDRDRRRRPRDRNEQETGDQDREERGRPDCDVTDPLRRRGNPNLFSPGSDRPRAADRSVDPPLLAHQAVHAPRGRHQAVDPTHSVHEAVRAPEPVDEAIHATSAVDEAVDLSGPARRRLRTRSADQPLAPAHPSGQESDGRRNG